MTSAPVRSGVQVRNAAVHVVVPEGIDNPGRPSGGNVYDRRVCIGLQETGWTLHEHHAAGSWPDPATADVEALAGIIAALEDGSTVLVDGLVGSSVPEVLVPAARRLRVVVLVHLPLGDLGSAEQERAVLWASSAVIATSDWTRRRLLHHYALPPHRVHVVEPGVGAARLAPGTASGQRLLCVAAVIAHKGHDVLLAALTALDDLSWSCDCVGALDREPRFVQHLREYVDAHGLGDRVRFLGPSTGAALERAYATADALVLASRAETYGMVVTEALARGLPVVATAVGGLPEALGRSSDGRRPGLLVPPGDPPALAGAVRRWLSDPELREGLRQAARDRRATLSDWSVTADGVARVLRQVAA